MADEKDDKFGVDTHGVGAAVPVFDEWQYRWTGVPLSLTAVTGIAIDHGASRHALADSVVGLGAAVVFWAATRRLVAIEPH